MELSELIELAREIELSPEDAEEQRRSFAHGNGALSNPAIGRDLIDQVADRG